MTGGTPELEISEKQWDELFQNYGHALSKETRREVEEICSNYLIWKGAESAATPTRVLQIRFEKIARAFKAFQPIGHGSVFAMDDAGHELQSILEEKLKDLPYTIPASDLSRLDGTSLNGEPTYLANLSLDQLMNITVSLSVALFKTREEIEQRLADTGQGFQPGQAFNQWLFRMKQWAKVSSLRYGLYQNSEPSKFVEFLFNLNKLFPEGCRDNVLSPSALAQRMKRISRIAKRDE